MDRSDIARVCHELNRAYCLAIGDPPPQPWEDTTPEQQASVQAGVDAVLENLDRKPEDNHAGWLERKLEECWTYGPVKDEAKREHPNMVPYDQLPAAQQAKDHIFIAAVRYLAPLLGE